MSANETLTSTEAQLFVRDMVRAVTFFTGKLGFTVEFLHGEPPYYGLVRRERAAFTLRLVHEPVFVGDIREREELLSGSVTVASRAALEALFAEFAGRGADFRQRLEDKPWGAVDFIVRDPDGNLLHFAGPGAA